MFTSDNSGFETSANSRNWFSRGRDLLEDSRYEDALVCFDWTLELNPAQPESHALRADVLRELERNDEALLGYDLKD